MSVGKAEILDDYEQLREQLSETRKGKKLICTIGSWDILHLGHIEYLKRAHDLGDILVVGVDSDLAYQRNKNKPVMYPQRDRQEILSAVRSMDFVTLIQDVDLSGEWQMELLKIICPDVFVCNEKSYPVEQRKRLSEVCRIEILPFYIPGSVSSSAAVSEKI